MQTTVKQLAVKQGVSYGVASGLVNFLVAKNKAEKVGKIPNPTGRGKGSNVFEIPDTVSLQLG